MGEFTPNIALLSCDEALCSEWSAALGQFGQSIDVAGGISELQQLMGRKKFEVVIFYADDSDRWAVDFYRTLQGFRAGETAAAMVIGSRLDDNQRVAAYDAGADFVFPATASLREAVACVRSLLKKRAPRTDAPDLMAGAVSVDCNNAIASCCGGQVRLAPTALRLLTFFMRNPSRLITREELAVRHYRNTPMSSRTIDQQVCRLRLALGCDTDAPPIRTVLKEGYVFDPSFLEKLDLNGGEPKMLQLGGVHKYR